MRSKESQAPDHRRVGPGTNEGGVVMRYVYVPYLNKTMDEFAVALVREKNQKNLVFGRYKKIDRDIQSGSRPLSVVGSGDRLYVLVHGSETPGVCVYKGFDSAT